jgi:hypothetical protein
MKKRLSRMEYHKWYLRRLDVLFHYHCGTGMQFTTPLSRPASIRYCAYWLGLAAVSRNPVRAIACRRALTSGLRAAVGRRIYSAKRAWMAGYSEGFSL